MSTRFCGITRGKKPLERRWRRCDIDITTDLKHWMGRHGLDVSESRQELLAGCCECGNEPTGSKQCGEFCD
jgi:hypothetical protein